MRANERIHRGKTMSKIYIITNTEGAESFVRAKTAAGALRAFIADRFTVEAASTDAIVEASKNGGLEILDALSETDDASDPGPVPT